MYSNIIILNVIINVHNGLLFNNIINLYCFLICFIKTTIIFFFFFFFFFFLFFFFSSFIFLFLFFFIFYFYIYK